MLGSTSVVAALRLQSDDAKPILRALRGTHCAHTSEGSWSSLKERTRISVRMWMSMWISSLCPCLQKRRRGEATVEADFMKGSFNALTLPTGWRGLH